MRREWETEEEHACPRLSVNNVNADSKLPDKRQTKRRLKITESI